MPRGQLEADFGAATGVIRGEDGAAVRGDDVVRDGQAEAGSRGGAGAVGA